MPFRPPPPAAPSSGGRTGTAIFGGSLRGQRAGMTPGPASALRNGVGRELWPALAISDIEFLVLYKKYVQDFIRLKFVWVGPGVPHS